MSNLYISKNRLLNQGLVNKSFRTAEEVVSWFGAVQSQEYPGATWSLGMRIEGSKAEDIDQAFNEGKILRTHIMRPTWHFVTAEDICWIQKLTSPRVIAFCNNYYRKMGLDEKIFKHSNEVIHKSLEGGKYLTRDELSNELKKAKIDTGDTIKLSFIMMRAELDSIICSGPKKGKQFSYALLDERIPKFPEITKEEALSRLALKYFQSHGPASIKDFSWWSGLTIAEAKLGLELNKDNLFKKEVDGKTYWFNTQKSGRQEDLKTEAYLLPSYDEYTVAYKDRSDILKLTNKKVLFNGAGFWASMIYEGQVVGMWRRTIKKNQVIIQLNPLHKMSKEEVKAFEKAADEYAKFFEFSVTVTM